MSVQKVTITNCEKEPIHVIGKSQSYGVILVCNPVNLEITQCTENAKQVLGMASDYLLGTNLSVILSTEKMNLLKAKLDNEKNLLPDEDIINDKKYYIIPHLSEGNLVLDIEPAGVALQSSLYQDQLYF